MIDQQQAKFEGFALVEIMGHQRVAGFVTTEYFGNVAVFHVVMPEVAAEEIEIPARQWIDTEYLEAGSRVRISRPKVEQFVAASSLYRLTPCTQADAAEQQPRVVDVIERRTRPLLNSGIECPNCFAALSLESDGWTCTAGCSEARPLQEVRESLNHDPASFQTPAGVKVPIAGDRPLGDLELSTRPYCALLDANIQTVGQLAQMSKGQVRSIKNVGPISLREIKEALGNLGLSLGMKVDCHGRLVASDAPDPSVLF